MNKRQFHHGLLPVLQVTLLAVLFAGCFPGRAAPGAQARMIFPTSQAVPQNFEHVTGPREFAFPRDLGPHPGFQMEWWYYTGNLQTQQGRRFGYQLTFFRRAISAPDTAARRETNWTASQVYMAHFTLTDVSSKEFHYYERFERGAAGLAGARGDTTFSVWLDDWRIEQTGQDVYHLKASGKDAAIDFRLEDKKGFILQGDRGYSQKGPQPGNASLYFSQTRLETTGTVILRNESYPVSGFSWMDREISSSALSRGQVGWDWFSLQLDDGSELMAYDLRRGDGSIDPFSNASFIQSDKKVIRFVAADFRITYDATWRSPHSGAVYPARWRVQVPSLNLDLTVQPLIADQELNVSFVYWEGAVRISGTRAGKKVTGFGYTELTGYYRSLQGTL